MILAFMPAILPSDDNIRSICSNVIKRLIRHGSEALRPSIPQLASSLLEGATEMDTQALSYVHHHVDNSKNWKVRKSRPHLPCMPPRWETGWNGLQSSSTNRTTKKMFAQ